MKLTVIIAEYNPLHNGHLYHIGEARKLGNKVVAIQSGAFVQRGECAVLDKYDRGFSAVKNGIDLVLELPSPFSFAPADKFALGAFKVIEDIDADITLSFGSEVGNIEVIKQTAHILLSEPADFKALLKENIQSGLPFNKARYKALNEYAKENKLEICDVAEPNNILAVEYAKLNESKGYPVKLHTVQRLGNYKGNNSNYYKSASEIREYYKNNKPFPDNSVPDETQTLIDLHNYIDNDIIYLFSVLNHEKSDISNIFDVKEGLENKIYSEALNSSNTKKLLDATVNARYTESRIRRILTNILLNVTNESFDDCVKEPPLLNLLACKREEREILKSLKSNVFTSQSGLSHSDTLQARLTYKSQLLFKVLRGYANDHALFL